jgi:hypothetical protein
MNTSEKSLRQLIEKWLAPISETPIRVIRFSRAHAGRCRCVRVEALRLECPVSLFFFRHDDGTWHVFPPETRRLTIRAYGSVV